MFWFPIFYLWCVASPTLRPQLVSSALCSWFPSESFYLLGSHGPSFISTPFSSEEFSGVFHFRSCLFWPFCYSDVQSPELALSFPLSFFLSLSWFSPVCFLDLLSGSFSHLFLPTLILSFQFLLSYFYYPRELLSEHSLFVATGLVLWVQSLPPLRLFIIFVNVFFLHNLCHPKLLFLLDPSTRGFPRGWKLLAVGSY